MFKFSYFSILTILIYFISNTDHFLFKSRSSTIKIGSFNLRRYSSSKAASTNIVNSYISKILTRYDLVFLQEIIDSSNDNRVVTQLINYLNKKSSSIKYESIVSPPLGLTSYKERLVYLYRRNSKKFQIISSYVYNGTKSKIFERQPFILHIKLFSSSVQTIFVGVHLKPDNVYDEFRSLRDIVNDFNEKSSIVMLGDFNADCSYLNNVKKNELRKVYFKEFQWLIDDRTETNLLQSCSYDRILVSSGLNRWEKINWKSKTNQTYPFDKIFKLSKDTALKISDHYPVEVDIY